MNEKQAAKQAARESKNDGARYVVWVPDCGRSVYDADQMRIYGELVFIEAVFIGGMQINSTEAA